MTGDAAIRGIRQVDSAGPIGLISEETDPPYNRPPLSKGLWKRQSIKHIWRKTEDLGVELHLGRQALRLDPDSNQLVDSQETVYTFDKLLLAIGGAPRRLPFEDDAIIYFRTLEDYKRLRALTEQGQRFGVIGGGFIGSEIAAALVMNGKEVVMLFPEAGIGGLAFPRDLARHLNDFYRGKGVEVLPGEFVVGLEARPGRFSLQTKKGIEVLVDGIVAGLGIQPNTLLAETAGLEVDNGIVVDESLRTSHPDIYAAGDVATFYNPTLDKWLRVEHEDNANTMGLMAGQAMAGEPVAYDHLPYFYSDMFELGYEAVGELNPELEAVADWQEPYQKGVIYYLQQGQVRGVILWNVWGQVDAARALMSEPGPFTPEDLKGRLPA